MKVFWALVAFLAGAAVVAVLWDPNASEETPDDVVDSALESTDGDTGPSDPEPDGPHDDEPTISTDGAGADAIDPGSNDAAFEEYGGPGDASLMAFPGELDGTGAAGYMGDPGALADGTLPDLPPGHTAPPINPGDFPDIQAVADASVREGDTWILKGEGTEDDPYRITWEYLVSAGETYNPRKGLDLIPQHIMDLDEKWVRIAGYVLIPFGAESATELLVMLNMWDGCCIGVPPTAYDAIEVGLTDPLEMDLRKWFNYGTITGKMDVDPYLVNGWLMGLYLIDDGIFEGAEE